MLFFDAFLYSYSQLLWVLSAVSCRSLQFVSFLWWWWWVSRSVSVKATDRVYCVVLDKSIGPDLFY